MQRSNLFTYSNWYVHTVDHLPCPLPPSFVLFWRVPGHTGKWVHPATVPSICGTLLDVVDFSLPVQGEDPVAAFSTLGLDIVSAVAFVGDSENVKSESYRVTWDHNSSRRCPSLVRILFQFRHPDCIYDITCQHKHSSALHHWLHDKIFWFFYCSSHANCMVNDRCIHGNSPRLLQSVLPASLLAVSQSICTVFT